MQLPDAIQESKLKLISDNPPKILLKGHVFELAATIPIDPHLAAKALLQAYSVLAMQYASQSSILSVGEDRYQIWVLVMATV